MGHRRLAGYVSEEQVFGAPMVRIDIPLEHGGEATQHYAPASLYGVSWTTEEMARMVAYANAPQPVHPWEARRALPEATDVPFETPGMSMVVEDDDGQEDVDPLF
jgi:hypothetical protein